MTEEKKGSDEYHRFARSVLAGPSSQAEMEDFDLGALSMLLGAEREAAQILLLERLDAGKDDPRVPRALKMIGSEKAKEEMRKALFLYPNNYTRVALADALWELEMHPDAVIVLEEIMTYAPGPEVRSDAARVISKISGGDVDMALAEAWRSAGDDEYAIRNALFQRLGIEEYERERPPELEKIITELMSEDRIIRMNALMDLKRFADDPERMIKKKVGDRMKEASDLLMQYFDPELDNEDVTNSLEPLKEDYFAYFTDDTAEKAFLKYQDLWKMPEKGLGPQEGQTDLMLFEATIEDLREQNQKAFNFPGGYARASYKIREGIVIYFFKFVKPGESVGMTVDGLTFVNGHWVLFPKPWNVLGL